MSSTLNSWIDKNVSELSDNIKVTMEQWKGVKLEDEDVQTMHRLVMIFIRQEFQFRKIDE